MINEANLSAVYEHDQKVFGVQSSGAAADAEKRANRETDKRGRSSTHLPPPPTAGDKEEGIKRRGEEERERERARE